MWRYGFGARPSEQDTELSFRHTVAVVHVDPPAERLQEQVDLAIVPKWLMPLPILLGEGIQDAIRCEIALQPRIDQPDVRGFLPNAEVDARVQERLRDDPPLRRRERRDHLGSQVGDVPVQPLLVGEVADACQLDALVLAVAVPGGDNDAVNARLAEEPLDPHDFLFALQPEDHGDLLQDGRLVRGLVLRLNRPQLAIVIARTCFRSDQQLEVADRLCPRERLARLGDDAVEVRRATLVLVEPRMVRDQQIGDFRVGLLGSDCAFDQDLLALAARQVVAAVVPCFPKPCVPLEENLEAD